MFDLTQNGRLAHSGRSLDQLHQPFGRMPFSLCLASVIDSLSPLLHPSDNVFAPDEERIDDAIIVPMKSSRPLVSKERRDDVLCMSESLLHCVASYKFCLALGQCKKASFGICSR